MKFSLQACRVQAKMSQQEAAQAVGVCKDTIARWENGTASPEMEQGLKLSIAYQIPLEYIDFSRVGNSPSQP